MSGELFQNVDRAIRSAAAEAIVPRFRALDASAISEKAPGDWVTDADRHSEDLLTAALHDLEPGTPVIGEEAAAAEPARLSALPSHERCWLVDPLDGTKSFIAGSPDIAVMIALLDGGVTIACWIWQPIHGVMFHATKGGGSTRDGQPISTPQREPGRSLQGVQRTALMPSPWRDDVISALTAAGLPPTDVVAAGATYPKLVEGDLDYALYWRTLPWDHAPGSLLASEAGLYVRRLDGTPYEPTDGRFGLLTALTPTVWDSVRDRLPDPPDDHNQL
jgi:fructose-1,6-bisphosphatase/inositol monophosphatase family enzyme